MEEDFEGNFKVEASDPVTGYGVCLYQIENGLFIASIWTDSIKN
jgi:hypothetical protein